MSLRHVAMVAKFWGDNKPKCVASIYALLLEQKKAFT